jgi:hypothetical protein
MLLLSSTVRNEMNLIKLFYSQMYLTSHNNFEFKSYILILDTGRPEARKEIAENERA